MTEPYIEISWEEFSNSGLLWWINRSLHLFGHAIVTSEENGKITRAYPAKTDIRGFTYEDEDAGFAKLNEYIKDFAASIVNNSDIELGT